MTAMVTDLRTSFETKGAGVGGGGYVTGGDIHKTSGKCVVRTDTAGAYIRDNATRKWDQLCTVDRIPSLDYIPEGGGPSEAVDKGGVAGVYEICIADSNDNHIWMAVEGSGTLFKSTNGGTLFTRAPGFTWLGNVPAGPGGGEKPFHANAESRLTQNKMAIDPFNPDIVYVGTEMGALRRTIDGGTSFVNLATMTGGLNLLPLQTYFNVVQMNRIAFDASGGTVTVSGQTRCRNIFVQVPGQLGIHKSTDGGVTFSLISGGFTATNHAACMDVDSAGTLFAVAWGSGDAFKLVGTTWTTLGTGYQSVGVKRDAANRAIFGQGGGARAATNAGATALTAVATVSATAVGDAEWQVWNEASFLGCGAIRYDPTVTDGWLLTGGFSAWEFTGAAGVVPNNTMQSRCLGIHQLIPRCIIHPPGGTVYAGGWDQQVFSLDTPDIPATKRFGSKATDHAGWPIVANHGMDYCETKPQNVVHMNAWGINNGRLFTTRDGGKTFAQKTYPLWAFQTDWAYGGGQIAMSRNDPLNMVAVAGGKTRPAYTIDGGTTWTYITVPGTITDTTDGWGALSGPLALYQATLIADRNADDTFYMWVFGDTTADNGIYKSINKGIAWTRIYTGTGGSPWGTGSGAHRKLRSVPGQAGHFYACTGHISGLNTDTVDKGLYKSTDSCVSFTKIGLGNDVAEVLDVGFGKASSGNSYGVDLWIYGYVNGVAGVYRSQNPGDAATSVAWDRITDQFPGPRKWLFNPHLVTPSRNVPDKAYFGCWGAGFAYVSPVGKKLLQARP